MEHLMAPFLTIVLLTFATDHIGGQTIIASQNPLPVGSSVTLSLSNKTTVITGSWFYESNAILIIFNTSLFTFPMWKDRVTFNHDSAELSIRSLQVSESGLYTLSGGKPPFEAGIALSVQEIIVNVTLRASAAHLVELNDSVVLTCGVSGGSSLSYDWTKNGSAVTPADRGVLLASEGAVLTIAAVSRDDRGPFVCRVHNGVSDGASGPILLNISYGPSDSKMAISPAMPAYKTGSNVTLSCHAESRPAATVRWFFNEVDLGLDGPQIQLKHTRENQTGYYKCLLHNAVTSRYSSVETMVRIMDPISHVDVSHAGGPVIMGQSVTLSCDVNGSAAAISWWKNGTAVTASNTTSLGNKSLTFNPVMHSDTGDYQCRAVDLVSNMTSSPYMLIVYYGPERPVIAGPSAALAGARATLVCSTSSLPPSQYSWYFNGSLVANGSQYVTGPLTMDMSGEYTCMAFNHITGRNATAYATLTAYAPVTMVMVNASGVHPMLHDNFSLTCDAVGSVESTCWMKNGSALQTSSRITLAMDNSTLTFSPLQLSDDGYYECKAANPVSSLTGGRHALHVVYGPLTPAIAGPEAVRSGHHVTFSCSADSYPASSFRWKFYGWSAMGNASVGNASELQLGPLTANMGGVYACFAYNGVTHQSSSAEKTLRVVDPITHVQIESPSTKAKQGLSFTLTCNATGGPVDHVYWMKNGRMLYADNTTALSMHNHTLTFNPVHKEDTGHYQCAASNAVTNMTSPAFALQVIYPITHVQIESPSTKAKQGLSFTLTCNATGGPVDHVYWMKNGRMLYADNTTALSMHNHTLTFNPVHKEDTGHYQCAASNAVTNMTSPAFALQVIFGPYTPPTIMGPLIAETGDYVVFHCNASSYPPSYYHWYYNGTLVGNDSHFETGPLSFSMSGVYTCTAVNNVTEKNSTNSAWLTVIEAIEHVIVKEDSLPIQSHNFTLSCEVAGPYDFMYWMKDGIRLGGDNSSADGSHVSHYVKNDSLRFSPVTTRDDGVYRCVAVNAVRPHTSPDHVLLVNYGPLKVHIEGPHVAHKGSVISVVVTCSAESRPTSHYQWFIGNAPVVVEAGPQLTISATSPSVVFNYTCKAYNNVTNIIMTASKTFSLNDAPSHSAASPRILLFMALSALSLPMLGEGLFN